jgi:hypothetical protein
MLFPNFEFVIGYGIKSFIMVAHRGMSMLAHMCQLCSKNLLWVNLTDELFILFFVFQIMLDFKFYCTVDGVVALFQAIGMHLKRFEVNDI